MFTQKRVEEIHPLTKYSRLQYNQLWKSNAASVVRVFVFVFVFFLNKVKIMLIYDEPLLSGQPPLSCPSAYSECGS